MDDNGIAFLKSHIDREAMFYCKDGEVTVGRILIVSAEEQDVIYDLVSSHRIARYGLDGRQNEGLRADEGELRASRDAWNDC